MPQNLKQFNFKLPESLLKQLEELSKRKGVTKTELVIQGIQHVLGFNPDKPNISDIDSGLYQQLDNLEQRLQESIDYQSTVDLETNRRIKALEEIVKDLQSRLSIPDIAGGIVNASVERIPSSNQDIADDIALNLDTEKTEDSTNPDIDKNIVPSIDNLTKAEQLELVQVESDDKALVEKSKTVDSVEMLKALRAEDPQGKWDNDHLTKYRRFKNLKDKWHKVGTLQFKYTGESQKAPNSSKILYLWFVHQPDKI
jgi:hypothetical protein